MTAVVIDTGPLVAWLNRRDQHHRWSVQILDTVEVPLITCEPVLSEACFLLQGRDGQAAVLELVTRGVLKIGMTVAHEVATLQALMRRFASVPMSLADACLVRITELYPRSVVLTIDRDFLVYRRNRRQAVPTIMPNQLR